jgi:hypothetical protein
VTDTRALPAGHLDAGFEERPRWERVTLTMWARQCLQCGAIDPRETLRTEDQANAVRGEWRCAECGAAEFDAVVMPEDEPTVELTDDYE